VSNAIELNGLSKTFRSRVRPTSGLVGVVGQFLRPSYEAVMAIRDVSFSIERGERVAFIGPNGAGKSTTIKVLCGVLLPTSGSVHVLGREPWRERRALGYEIAAVFGQRSRLWLHLPAGDTFDLLARVYDQDDAVYARRRNELIEIFQVADLVGKPVRQLSLGERMRCELVAALLHRPKVLFLDEPTIGLDVVAKAALRDLVLEMSEREGTTVLLTSHDTADMERVCDRALVIHRGRLLLDQGVAALRSKFIQRKLITALIEEEDLPIRMPGVRVTRSEPHRIVLEVDTDQLAIEGVVRWLLANAHVQDLTVEDPPMDEIVQLIYGQGEPVHEAAVPR
jgi:ABC-2 type transport system ATP-binding protein